MSDKKGPKVPESLGVQGKDVSNGSFAKKGDVVNV
jgi:hypothetical protein